MFGEWFGGEAFPQAIICKPSRANRRATIDMKRLISQLLFAFKTPSCCVTAALGPYRPPYNPFGTKPNTGPDCNPRCEIKVYLFTSRGRVSSSSGHEENYLISSEIQRMF